MFNFLTKILTRFLTNFGRTAKISETREVSTPPIREARLPAPEGAANGGQAKPITDSLSCPYCHSQEFQRRGFRKNVHENVQLYLCLKCHKTFTQKEVKGKHYPLSVIFDAISIYNLGYSLEETCRIMDKRMVKKEQQKEGNFKATKKSAFADLVHLTSSLNGWTDNLASTLSQKNQFVKSPNNMGVDSPGVEPGRFGLSIQPNEPVEPTPNLLSIQPSTLSSWLEEFSEYIKYARMRDYAMKLYPPKDQIIHATLAHQQLYRYMFHKAKAELIIKGDFEHRNYWPLKEFLEAVPYECPHQYYLEGLRASEVPLTFSKKQMIVRSKTNYANKIAAFVLQSVTDRKSRHEALQKFMLANDSVTVAAEVPVYLTKDDLLHMQTQLGFEIFVGANHDSPAASAIPKLITGHIDMIQIRNGQIHILDYKPNAAKERPIEQLTLYAMALSRLTGLRMFEFKCAWFDEKDYFEFYPLHVIHKLKRARRRKIETIEGVYKINKNPDKIESVKPNI